MRRALTSQERRSLGPATYDPRPGSEFVKPSITIGGDQGKGLRKPLLISRSGGKTSFLHRGVPEDGAPQMRSHASAPQLERGVSSPLMPRASPTMGMDSPGGGGE
jgi:hypothetical protein